MADKCHGLTGVFLGYFAPVHTVSRHVSFVFMRSIAQHLFLDNGILVNCISRRVVKIRLMSEEIWTQIPAECMTSTEQIVNMINSLLRDRSYGHAVEILDNNPAVNDGPPIQKEQLQKLVPSRSESRLAPSEIIFKSESLPSAVRPSGYQCVRIFGKCRSGAGLLAPTEYIRL